MEIPCKLIIVNGYTQLEIPELGTLDLGDANEDGLRDMMLAKEVIKDGFEDLKQYEGCGKRYKPYKDLENFRAICGDKRFHKLFEKPTSLCPECKKDNQILKPTNECQISTQKGCGLSINNKCTGNFSPLKCDGIDVPDECRNLKGNEQDG